MSKVAELNKFIKESSTTPSDGSLFEGIDMGGLGKPLALALAGALTSGALGAYSSSKIPKRVHETPEARNRRILKNALLYAAGGGLALGGLGLASGSISDSLASEANPTRTGLADVGLTAAEELGVPTLGAAAGLWGYNKSPISRTEMNAGENSIRSLNKRISSRKGELGSQLSSLFGDAPMDTNDLNNILKGRAGADTLTTLFSSLDESSKKPLLQQLKSVGASNDLLKTLTDSIKDPKTTAALDRATDLTKVLKNKVLLRRMKQLGAVGAGAGLAHYGGGALIDLLKRELSPTYEG